MSPRPSPSPRPGLFWLVTLVLLASGSPGSRESQLRIGKAINIFLRYGYLSISMRVIPLNDMEDPERWVFKEPTKNVYRVSFLIKKENHFYNRPNVFYFRTLAA